MTSLVFKRKQEGYHIKIESYLGLLTFAGESAAPPLDTGKRCVKNTSGIPGSPYELEPWIVFSCGKHNYRDSHGFISPRCRSLCVTINFNVEHKFHICICKT